MMYKGFEIKAVKNHGTLQLGAFLNGKQLVKQSTWMGQRTGETVEMLFIDEATAKATIRYLIKTGAVEEHI